MYRTILVPLDGSPLGEQALPVACDVARRAGAELRLCHAITRTSPAPILVEGLPVLDEELRSLGPMHDRVYLERLRDRLAAEHDLTVTVATLDAHGTPEQEHSVAWLIARHAVTVGADLIVMTTHGRGGLSRFWLGSTADALVRLSTPPVLLIRAEEDRPEAGQPFQVRRIFLPLDGSARSEAIVGPALALGRAFGAEYTLLHIVVPAALGPAAPFTTPTDFDPERTRRDEAEARRYLDAVALRLERDGATVRSVVRVADQVAPAILEECQGGEGDLIAMSTAGRSGLRRLLIGSVADKVLRRAEVPLLLHRDEPAVGA